MVARGVPAPIRILPAAMLVVGALLLLGCAVGLYAAGLVIDERMEDPGDSLVPLWAGAGVGALLVIVALVLWATGGVRRRASNGL